MNATESQSESQVERKTITTDDCWLFAGKIDKSGHGRVYAGQVNGKVLPRPQVYRVMYEELVGEIPEGLVLDHLCENPPCINPAHLEPVTQAENVFRGFRKRTHCRNGHEYTPENIYWKKGYNGFNPANPEGMLRVCRTCAKANQLKYKGLK